jgi:hypothetical protein
MGLEWVSRSLLEDRKRFKLFLRLGSNKKDPLNERTGKNGEDRQGLLTHPPGFDLG